MKANRKRDTGPELRLRSAVHRLGLRYRLAVVVVAGGVRVVPDLVFPAQRVAVFVDGCFWHRCPTHGTAPRANDAYWGPKLDRNVARDRAVTVALEAAGWSVTRLWEHDIRESPEACAARIRTAVRAG